MIKIKGHSIFKVETKLIDNTYYILKSSDKENASRLEKQIKKQEFIYPPVASMEFEIII